MAEANTEEPATEEPATEDSPASPPQALPPLALSRGRRIQMGYRKGRVEEVRGGGAKPYDFKVRWESEKYPTWLLWTTAERDYQRGSLRVLP